MDGAIIVGKLSHSYVWKLMLANKWDLSRGCQRGHLYAGVFHVALGLSHSRMLGFKSEHAKRVRQKLH